MPKSLVQLPPKMPKSLVLLLPPKKHQNIPPVVMIL